MVMEGERGGGVGFDTVAADGFHMWESRYGQRIPHGSSGFQGHEVRVINKSYRELGVPDFALHASNPKISELYEHCFETPSFIHSNLQFIGAGLGYPW